MNIFLERIESRVTSELQSGRYNRLLRAAIVVFSFFFVLLFLYTAARRMRYPYDVEWIESGILVEVMRIAHGQPLYTAPTLDYIPFLYGPLYFYLAAALSKVTGLTFFSTRLLSTLATCGSFTVIYAFVHRETRRPLAAVASVGLFAACYPLSEAFFDIGRTDSLLVFLMLLALYFTRRGWLVPAALAWILATQTKQSFIPIAFLVLLLQWQRPRRMIAGLAVYIGGQAATIFLFNHFTHGWYNFYLFGGAEGIGTVWRTIALYVPNVVFAPFSGALLLACAAFIFTKPSLRSEATQFYAVISLTLFFALWYVSRRAATNSMEPIYAWISILMGVSLHRLLRLLESTDTSALRPFVPLLLLSVLMQISLFMYNPGRYLPSPEMRAYRERLIAEIRSIPGDVYITNHSSDALLAGKKPHADMEAMGLLLDEAPNPVQKHLREEMQTDVDSQRYSAFVVDVPVENSLEHSWMPADFLQHYPLAVAAPGQGQPRFLTSRPQWILLPCSALSQPHEGYLTSQSSVIYGSCKPQP